VLYPNSSPVVKQQYVDIEYMMNKKDMHFNRVLKTCDLHEITGLLHFRHNWNQEVIAEFYSTLFYDKKEMVFMWMTNGRRLHVQLTRNCSDFWVIFSPRHPQEALLREGDNA
jgi:hypothetical protein